MCPADDPAAPAAQASTTAPTNPGRPGRPRAADVDRRLHETVLQLLREGGPGAVTIDGVTSHSGVAKTTIYRRYSNRGELLTAVLRQTMSAPDVPRDGNVRDKLRSALEQAWHQMSDALGPGGLAALISNSDPEFTELFRSALRPYIDMLVQRMNEDANAGVLRHDLDADGVVSLMIGAYVGELVRHGEVAPGWLDRTIELLWNLMVPPS
ncbi:TetR/AcrR family transcriptional regulator [Nocardioides sp. T5]|uniref:TetR/AcrR family transcriptional regulator n=1 Tax=Nocardioides sp. T5 TaxID=3400182 RepID=UPI003A8906D3